MEGRRHRPLRRQLAIKYSPKVIEHFTTPLNAGDLPDADAVATEGSPACGDMVTFALKINPATRVIEDIRFRSFGCASNIATASMATLLAKGKTTDEVKRLTHRDLVQALDGLPAVKLHCSVLAMDGLKAAVLNWEVENGLAEAHKIEFDIAGVATALAGVVNPRTGLTLTDSGMVGRTETDPEVGRVYVEILFTDLDERFAENIEAEVRERLVTIPGVERIVVQFKLRGRGE